MKDSRDLISNLRSINNVLLSEQLDYSELKQAIEHYKRLLKEISNLDFDRPEARSNIHLDSGKAIGPEWAAMCVDDIMRTKCFISGVDKAIQSLRLKTQKEPVHILYCGPGPFATLVLPLITKYTPQELRFEFIEINPQSVSSLKHIFETLNCNDYILGIHQEDAAKFKYDKRPDIDILLIECLQHALAREPQVAITYNLLPQLKRDAILIPEQINLHLCLINTRLQQEIMLGNEVNSSTSYFKNIDPIFTLSKKEVVFYPSNIDLSNHQFPLKETILSNEDIESYNLIAISTELNVFEDCRLLINESGLTIPKILDYQTKEKPIARVLSQYILSNEPGMRTTLIT